MVLNFETFTAINIDISILQLYLFLSVVWRCLPTAWVTGSIRSTDSNVSYIVDQTSLRSIYVTVSQVPWDIYSFYYPHVPIGKVWIYHLLLLCLFVCLFVRIRISPPRIKLAASNLARRFIGVQGRESLIFVNFASPESPKLDESASARATPPAYEHQHRDAPT